MPNCIADSIEVSNVSRHALTLGWIKETLRRVQLGRIPDVHRASKTSRDGFS